MAVASSNVIMYTNGAEGALSIVAPENIVENTDASVPFMVTFRGC